MQGKISVAEAAARLTITPEAVRFAIRRRKIKAVFKFRQYWISEAEIARYPRSRQAEAAGKGKA